MHFRSNSDSLATFVAKWHYFEAETNNGAVKLHLEPYQLLAVVFTSDSPGSAPKWVDIAARIKEATPIRINTGWTFKFDKPGAEPSIKYYSGTAVYRTSFELDESIPSETIFLDLGSVEIIAHVKLNGQDCGIAWKPPYKVNVTDALRKGKNELEISVVNLWTNRLIGDEQLAQDATWIEVPEGNWKDCLALYEWPEWFKTGRNRTSGRYTFTSCIHYRKDSPLLPSGLLGPVSVQSYYSGN